MKKLITITIFLTLGIWSFAQSGGSKPKILLPDSIVISKLAGTGNRPLAANATGVILTDQNILMQKDTASRYYSQWYVDEYLATKGELQAASAGIIVKDSVSVVAISNLDLSGSETIDGVATFTGMRVLVKSQTDSIQNGVYRANNSGAWTRATDSDSWAELIGAYYLVNRGDDYAGASYVAGIGETGTVGVNKIWFNIFATPPTNVVAGAGLVKVGNQIYVDDDDSTIEIIGNELTVKAEFSATKIDTSYLSANAYDSATWNGSIKLVNQNQFRDRMLKLDSTYARGGTYIDIDDWDYTLNGFPRASYANCTGCVQPINPPNDAFVVPRVSSKGDGLMRQADYYKLAGIETGAEVNVNADWNSTSGDSRILNKPSLSAGDTAHFNVSGASPSKILTAKAGVNNVFVNAANDTNQVVIGSSTSATDIFLRNQNGTGEWYNTARSGLRLLNANGSVGISYNGTVYYSLPRSNGTAGQVLTTTGVLGSELGWSTVSGGSGGSGTVTSVGLSLPTELTVTGSPVTTSGTLTAAWASQPLNYVFAAPATATGTPSFRAIVDNDIPNTITASNYLPLAGGTMTGLLTMPANTATAARFRLTPGTSNPTVLNNGDMWTTSAGIFARINGTTVSLGTSGSGGLLTFTSSVSTGLYDAGTSLNPFPKVTINQLDVNTAVLGDEIVFSDSSATAETGGRKPIYRTTLRSLKNLIGTSFNLKVGNTEDYYSNIDTIDFDGLVVTNSGSKVTISGGGGSGVQGFQTLAETGSINWSWLTSNNAQISDMDGNITLSFTNQTNGQDAELWVFPDASIDYVLTFPIATYFNNDHDNTFNIEHGTGYYYVFSFKTNATITRCDYAVYKN